MDGVLLSVFVIIIFDIESQKTHNNQRDITKSFKHRGIYNALDGSENHLIRLRKLKGYKALSKEDAKE